MKVPNKWRRVNGKIAHFVTKIESSGVKMIAYKSWSVKNQRWDHFLESEDSVFYEINLSKRESK